MQKDKVAHDVAVNGADEGRTTAFQTFKQIGATEAHQTDTGPPEALHNFAFRWRRRMVRVRFQIISKPVSGQGESFDQG